MLYRATFSGELFPRSFERGPIEASPLTGDVQAEGIVSAFFRTRL